MNHMDKHKNWSVVRLPWRASLASVALAVSTVGMLVAQSPELCDDFDDGSIDDGTPLRWDHWRPISGRPVPGVRVVQPSRRGGAGMRESGNELSLVTVS